MQATSGVWLHDASSFERLGRIAPTGATAIAVDDKRSNFAMSVETGGQCAVTVYDARSFRALGSTRADCPNGRMRFSEDGETLAIPSMGGNSATVFAWRKNAAKRIANSTDVNDAIPFSKGTLVATVDDSDQALVTNVRTGRILFSSHSFDVRTTTWRVPTGAFTSWGWPPKRDLNTVFVSEARETLYFGGEENFVWIFGFVPVQSEGDVTFNIQERVGPLKGNIEDILPVSEGRTLVATDAGLIYVFDSTWKELSNTGHAGLNLRNDGITLSPNGRSVLVTLNGRVFDWSGGDNTANSHGYAFGEPKSVYDVCVSFVSYGQEDAVFTNGFSGKTLLRVRKPHKNMANVFPHKIAEYTHSPLILTLTGGTRLVRVTEDGFCAFERLVKGKPTSIGPHFAGKCPVGVNHPRRNKVGIVDNTGILWTLDQAGHVRKVGTFGLPYEGMTDRANLRYLNGAWEFQDGGVTERIRDR